MRRRGGGGGGEGGRGSGENMSAVTGTGSTLSISPLRVANITTGRSSPSSPHLATCTADGTPTDFDESSRRGRVVSHARSVPSVPGSGGTSSPLLESYPSSLSWATTTSRLPPYVPMSTILHLYAPKLVDDGTVDGADACIASSIIEARDGGGTTRHDGSWR